MLFFNDDNDLANNFVYNDDYFGGNNINYHRKFLDDFNKAVHNIHHVDEYDNLINPKPSSCSICKWRVERGRRASDRPLNRS